jgi:hypothetical protein
VNGPKQERIIHKSRGLEISTNIDGFKWPTRDEKIAGLLSAGLIDQAEADRLSALPTSAQDSAEEPQP